MHMKNKLILILSLCTIVQAYGVGDIELSVLDACTVGVQNLFYSQNAKNEALVQALFKGNYAQAKFWLQNGVNIKTACKTKVYTDDKEIKKIIGWLYMDTQIDDNGQVLLILSDNGFAQFHDLEQLKYIVKKYGKVKNVIYIHDYFKRISPKK